MRKGQRMSELICKPLEPISPEEAREQLKNGSEEELILLPLRIGEHCEY